MAPGVDIMSALALNHDLAEDALMKYRMTMLAALMAVAVGAISSSFAANDVHFALSKSMPEAESSIESPGEIRLWFTESPVDNTTSIRVVNAAGELMEAADVMQDADDGRIFSVAIERWLAVGPYTVAWRAIGQDGHVVREEFTFSVTQQ
jgi:methionine-rich copper-binding protein CopC